MNTTEIIKLFPQFTDKALIQELLTCTIHEVSEGDVLMRRGQYIKYIPLILNGSIKVIREDNEGNEVLLYFLQSGSSCAMSITCCMQSITSGIEAIAEQNSKLLMIPLQKSELWMSKYSNWRNFILMSYSVRMDELLNALDSIAFHSLDQRLIEYLNKKSHTSLDAELQITHSEIAKDLNSSREAISRLLKKLENLGKVKLARNKIKILQ